MNKWVCVEPGCTAVAIGIGPAFGLRAIGWTFQRGGPILCPAHRVDGVPFGHPDRTRAAGDCEEPGNCGACAGERDVAEYLYGGRGILTEQERRDWRLERERGLLLDLSRTLLEAGHAEAANLVATRIPRYDA